MENDARINGLEETIKRYETMLYRTEAKYYNKGRVEGLQELRLKVRDYHGKEFLNSLHLQVHEYFEWKDAPTIIAKYLTPLQHVLMMEFFCGSVEEFYKQKV